jgi:hypothetical protein
MDKFLKAITKNPHALFLHPIADSPFYLFIEVIQVSTMVFLHFWGKYGSCTVPSLDCMVDAIQW